MVVVITVRVPLSCRVFYISIYLFVRVWQDFATRLAEQPIADEQRSVHEIFVPFSGLADEQEACTK